jgi:hypothetical protein
VRLWKRRRQIEKSKIKIYFINFYFAFLESGGSRPTLAKRGQAGRKTIDRTLPARSTLTSRRVAWYAGKTGRAPAGKNDTGGLSHGIKRQAHCHPHRGYV